MTENCNTLKMLLRKKMLTLRKENRAQIASLSNTAQSLILKEKIWQNSCFPALYMALPGETETNLLFENAINAKKTPLLPRILNLTKKTMAFFPCANPETLTKGPMNILEPPASEPAMLPDLMIIPGLAFDKTGHRLGYGCGFYDRYLAALPAVPLLAGLCFSWQVLRHVPADAFDYKVNAICTEKEIFWIGKERQICQTDDKTCFGRKHEQNYMV